MKRVDYIDTAKGIAIILVVLQHASISISNYIMSFHMPFFFMIYGFTLDDRQLTSSSSLKKKIMAYIVPYFIWAFVYLRHLKIESYLRILWGTSDALKGVSQATLWFLPVFFLSVVVYRKIMEKILISKYNKYLLCVASLICLAILDCNLNRGNLIENGLWFGCNIAAGGVMFMIFGYLFRKIFDFIIASAKIKRWCYIILLIIMGVVLIPTYKVNAPVIMGKGYYGNYCLYLLTAISQSIMLICVSYIICNKIFQYLGKNTMIIYLIHPIFLAMYEELGVDFYTKNANAICKSIFTIIMALLIAQVINRICPWLIGKCKVE